MVDLDQYTIGWVCALLPELTAARLHLDAEHDAADFESSPGDDNTYVLGSIGKHNVVVATLPAGEYGTSSAAAVAKDMIRSFPTLRVLLMVGIGGGVPLVREDQATGSFNVLRDIRLGDIVVSAPRNGVGGVLQPDLGRALPGGEFQRTSHLNQPPRSLLTAVQLLTSDIELHGQTIQSDIAAKLEGKPGLKQYKIPNPTSDRLFRSSFVHTGGYDQDCALVCAAHSDQIIHRPARDLEPQIHYGLIASSNTLMKDAELRDRLGTEDNILCIEMEAAGLMNQLPVLVIRGICDYADSHKNNTWQGYAAMTAAAYARMLLLKAAATRVAAAQKLSEMNGVREQLHDISGDIKQSNIIQQELLDLQKQSKKTLQDELFKWYSSLDQSMYELPEDHRKDIVLSMQILIYSKVSISAEELTDAVALVNYENTPETSSSLATVCAGVMIFTMERLFPINVRKPYQVKYTTRTQYKYEITSLSLKDFILLYRSKAQRPCLEGKLSADTANLAVALACLTCLLQSLVKDKGSRFLSYSSKYWIFHYEAAAKPNATLQDLALQFLTDQSAFQKVVKEYEFPSWISATTCRCPLFLVALHGSTSLITDLLSRDDSHHNHSCAAISAASSNGHVKVVKLLLNKGLRPDEQALHLALEGEHTDTIQVLSNNLYQNTGADLSATLHKLDLTG